MTHLADLTTLHLGGPAQAIVACRDQDSLVAAVRRCDDRGESVLLLGGGSNVVVADAGFAGTVIRVLTSGIIQQVAHDRILVTAQAGERWDRLVDQTVERGLAGIECLAGIPGSAGATPIQNVGAYGQEVAQTITHVVAYDRGTQEIRALSAAQCEFSYRSSVFKRLAGRWVVLSVTFALLESQESAPVRYAELAKALGIAVGNSAPVPQVRDAVLSLRRAKGMVLERGDPDTVSVGSFFLNPILEQEQLGELLQRVHVRLGPTSVPPLFGGDHGRMKTSAAWLIEHAGFHRGYGSPTGIAISSKHTLALTNRGQGSTSELIALAREIVSTVHREFGIELKAEPVFVGHT